MPKHRDPNDERERKEREQREQGETAGHEHAGREHEGHEGEREDRDRPRRRRMGREHAVHQQILERRVGGGAPATPEAYAKALEQWQKLPGSVMRPPTDEKPAAGTKKQGTGQGDDEEKRK